MTPLYVLEILGTMVFAVSGVFAVARRGLDVIGALALGMVTALGGGTVRDLILGVRPFWTADVNYMWAAVAGALGAFTLGRLMSRDLYVTPILLGCMALIALRTTAPALPYLSIVVTVVFAIRALAIYRHLEMPSWLTHEER